MRGISCKINPTLLTMNTIDYCLLKDIVIQLIFQLQQDYIGVAHIPDKYTMSRD